MALVNILIAKTYWIFIFQPISKLLKTIINMVKAIKYNMCLSVVVVLQLYIYIFASFIPIDVCIHIYYAHMVNIVLPLAI